MTEIAILLPKIRDEQPQRKRKLESPGSSVAAPPIQSSPKVNYDHDPWDDDKIDPVIEKEYHRQFVESDVINPSLRMALLCYVKSDWL